MQQDHNHSTVENALGLFLLGISGALLTGSAIIFLANKQNDRARVNRFLMNRIDSGNSEYERPESMFIGGTITTVSEMVH